ncbi:MAG: type II toxin-antitoxin system VapC family toxin [Acidobacteriota bacterium]
MILPDINLLLYAYNPDSPHHIRAMEWWETSLSGRTMVGLPWVVLLGFLRLVSNHSLFDEPLSPREALEEMRAWLDRPTVQVLQPGSRHLDLLDELMVGTAASSKLSTDCHLAALAIEYQAELHSNDSDFSRFPGLRWKNPLKD